MAQESDAQLLALFREYRALTESVEAAVEHRDGEILQRLGFPFFSDDARGRFQARLYGGDADRIRAEMAEVSDQIVALEAITLRLARTLIESQGLSLAQAENLAFAMLKIVHPE
jgi:hypothetical protein